MIRTRQRDSRARTQATSRGASLATAVLLTMTMLAGWLAMPYSAMAATLLLWPVQPVFEPGESAAALWVENRGESPTWIQVRVFGWEQANGGNRYRQQQDVIGSPPMMQIGPGERHLVRLIRQTPTPPGVEAAWRVILDEIPQRSDTPSGGPTRAGIHLQMRYSLPLFSYGEGLTPVSSHGDGGAADTHLEWRVVRQQGQAMLEMINRGDRHARLTEVTIEGEGRSMTLADGLLGYVLPHSAQRWPLPSSMPIESLRARINGQSAVVVDQADDAS
ncbi:fimbrial biogenesis chaperone [Salinicola socius]|uniref:Pili assembly chaperone N-terminal domain-containing protein n=1 Tax=Salinicola socius TaxID=404433 RepID=A0A1Q8SU75_9GAMM|nr:molecular chaperone [Salinicola socius]OLO04932.1 hypothetical protein BTW07_06835 [Salinicola socius]